jgi:two-component system chemotaxis response regulator CheB
VTHRTNASGRRDPARPFWVIGLVASAGGMSVLRELLASLPSTLPAALIVVQHLSPRHRSYLAEILARGTTLRVKTAEEGDRLHPGEVFVAPPDRHVVVNPDDTLSLCHSGRVRHVRPSGDVLFASLAVSCGARAIAVVLTGGDDDGATGARLVKAVGGTVIAQDQASSEEFAMPRAAIATGAVDQVLPPGRIAHFLGYLASREPGEVWRRSAPPPRDRAPESCEGAECNGCEPARTETARRRKHPNRAGGRGRE